MTIGEIIDDLVAQRQALPKGPHTVARMYLAIAIGALRTARRGMPRAIGNRPGLSVPMGREALKEPPPALVTVTEAPAVARRPRSCGRCGAIDHDARNHPEDAPAPAAASTSDDEDPEPEPEPDEPFPTSESLLKQRRANRRSPRLLVVPTRPTLDAHDRCSEQRRPCPWVACRQHLAIWDVTPVGTIRYAHPGARLADLPETCVLDVVAKHPEGCTLEEIGHIVGLTRERVRQVEVGAMEAVHDAADGEDLMPPERNRAA